MKVERMVLLLSVCSTLVSVGCYGPDGKTEKKCSACDTCTCDTCTCDTLKKQSPIEEKAEKPASATLLFDASVSMKGYLDANDSRFIGVVSSFENMPSAIRNSMYGTKEESPLDAQAFDGKLQRRDIAWSGESDLKAMVQSAVKHIDAGDDVCFIVTDGILSGSNEQINSSPDRGFNKINREKMANDISAILKSHSGKLSALIVRYNAKFNGTYSCYNNAECPLYNKERPFFVLALGKWSAIKYIEDELNQTKARNGIKTPYEDIVMIGDLPSYQKIKLSPSEGLNPKDGVLVIKRGYRTEKVVVSADLSALPAYMQTEEYMKDNIELYVQRGEQSRKAIGADAYKVEVGEVNGKPKLKLHVDGSLLPDSKLFFKLKYELPKWVELKSDDDDSDIRTNVSKLGKTFNLKYLVAGFESIYDGEYIKEQTLVFK